VKLRGGPRRTDEDVDVFLVDAPPTAPPNTVVLGQDTRRRRRWPELGLVLVGVAVVVGVGLLGGGDDGVEAAPKTSSTVTRPRPTTTRPHHRTTTTQPGRFTTTTVRRTTTTTTWPQYVAGTGPLLPGQPTGTLLGAVDGMGVITMLDLDTGDSCRTMVDRSNTYSPWGVQAMVGPVVVQSGSGTYVIDESCAAHRAAFDLNSSWLAASSGDTLWMGGGGGNTVFEEVSRTTYERTGRSFRPPPYSNVSLVAVGRDLVVSAGGEVALVDPDTDERRSLGTGRPIAARGRTVALVSCPELRCSLVLLDVDTGHRTVYETVHPVEWSQAAFSPDGTRLLLSVPVRDSSGYEDQPDTAIVDLGSGAITRFGNQIQGGVFTTDGRWLLTIEQSRVGARALDGSGVTVLLPDALRNVQALAVVR
jgi:hypothetical protein